MKANITTNIFGPRVAPLIHTCPPTPQWARYNPQFRCLQLAQDIERNSRAPSVQRCQVCEGPRACRLAQFPLACFSGAFSDISWSSSANGWLTNLWMAASYQEVMFWGKIVNPVTVQRWSLESDVNCLLGHSLTVQSHRLPIVTDSWCFPCPVFI